MSQPHFNTNNTLAQNTLKDKSLTYDSIFPLEQELGRDTILLTDDYWLR